jgi:hypothetical protein
MRRKKQSIPQWFISKNHGFACIAFMIVFHAISPYASEKIAIDENMPSIIPPEIIADWMAKDAPVNSYSSIIEKIKSELPDSLKLKVIIGTDGAAYLSACHWRRIARIQKYTEKIQRILYARHHDIGGPIIGYTEELQNDTFTSGLGKWGAKASESRGGDYTPGGALLTIEMKNYYPTPKVIINDDKGCIRDPCVSFDGKKVVFAWSKINEGYHIYEMGIDNPDKAPVQLTDNPPGLVVSDFEPCYLPNGDIVFNSSRCFGYVDCNFNITSNLYIMNKEGKYLRRVGFDQLHTCYPTMMSDGTILYSRWEYNDRNIATCFGLFHMNTDGSHQIEYFGNQTSWPSTIPQAREIPETKGKILAITGGHMGPYAGDLIIINPSNGRNGSQSVKLVAPRRLNPVDFELLKGVPDSCKLFQNPYPLDENWFLISYRTNVSSKFRIYLMNVDGDRELLAWDVQSVSQQQSLCPQPPPPSTAYQVDYSMSTGNVYMKNAYKGTGTEKAVDSGSIKKIRVFALEYHTDPSFGSSGSKGYTMTPVGRWKASWMAKRVLGEMKVESDGSAAVVLPARTPVYFQLIDNDGCAINTMRSWMTLMPGETFTCLGCHEDKNESPCIPTPAIADSARELDSVYGIKNDYLYYPKHIQPILTAKCVKCHQPGKAAGEKLDLTDSKIWTGDLTNDPDNVNASRFWLKSYYNLTMPNKYVNFIDVESPAEGLKPNTFGSKRSTLISMLRNPPRDKGMNVSLTNDEIGKMCMWIDLCIPHSGFYTDDMRPEDAKRYLMRLDRRKVAEFVEQKNIDSFIVAGGYKSYETAAYFNPASRNVKVVKNKLNVRLSQSGQRLIFRVPCKGEMTLLDMLGRAIMTYSVKEDAIDKNTSIAIQRKLPRGIYIVRFKGAGLTEHRIMSTL